MKDSFILSSVNHLASESLKRQEKTAAAVEMVVPIFFLAL